MNRISGHAEDVENDHPTAHKNKAAFAESAHRKEGASTGNNENSENKRHGFSNTVAKLKNKDGQALGGNAAIILRYVSYALRRYGKVVEGKKSVRVNLDHISRQYPYMGRSTVDENVRRLQAFGCCEIKDLHAEFHRPKYDRTRCYHVPKRWMDAAEEEPRYFDTDVAARVGVPAAVIYANFSYWISEGEKDGKKKCVRLAPAVFASLLPYNRSTIKRAINRLVEEGLIEKTPGERCWYVVGTGKASGSNPDRDGSKADKVGSNPDENGSKADNDIYCKTIVDSVEKENSKNQEPAAPSFSNVPDDADEKDEADYSLDDSIATTAEEQHREQMRRFRSFDPFSSPVPLSSRNEEDHKQHESSVASPSSAPSACDISGAAEDVKGKWPGAESLDQLHAINSENADFAESAFLQPGVSEKIVNTVRHICFETFSLLNAEQADELYHNEDGDEVLRALLPHYHQFLDLTHLDPESSLFDIIYYGALECLVGAFLWPKEHGDSYSHPIRFFISVSHNLYLVLWRREENEREKAIEEEFAQWRKQYASPDEHNGNDADLAPAEKMRVFRNGLSSRNKVGWIFYDQTHRTEQIKINATGLKRIQKLFELNEHLTAADLLKVMDRCMDAYRSRPAPGAFRHGVQWHARMGHNVAMFASYLRTITTQLEMKSPVEHYLNGPDSTPADEDAQTEAEIAA
jgi:hypothetical protein